MGDLDIQLINFKLKKLKAYLRRLKELQKVEREKFLTDDRHYGLAEHYLQHAIELVLDICRHFVASLELPPPEDSHSLFKLLREEKVLSPEFVERNSSMAGFRNHLVHEYENIDHEKVYQYLQEHFTDLEQFVREISDYLLKHK